jgi:hypothetical protein
MFLQGKINNLLPTEMERKFQNKLREVVHSIEDFRNELIECRTLHKENFSIDELWEIVVEMLKIIPIEM